MANSKKMSCWLEGHFVLIKKCKFQHYYCEAVAKNVIILLSTWLDKWEQLLISISRDLKYFDDVELFFSLDKFEFTGN